MYDIDNIYENIDQYNPNKNRKVLIQFGDMIICIVSKKKLKSMKENKIIYQIQKNSYSSSDVFVTQKSFAVPKQIRLNSTHYFIIKSPNKKELQPKTINYSSDIHF